MMEVDCQEESFLASFDFSKFTNLTTPWLDNTWAIKLRYIMHTIEMLEVFFSGLNLSVSLVWELTHPKM